jgi:hypothetical protein
VNTCVSIPDNLDPDSNAFEVSDQHRRNSPSPMTSSDPVSRNACFSIRGNIDADSYRNILSIWWLFIKMGFSKWKKVNLHLWRRNPQERS